MQGTLKKALVLVFFVGNAGLLVNFNATPGRAQEVKRNAYLPQLADLMNESMQINHAKLWFAGHAGNWALAAYEVKKIRGTIDQIKATPNNYCVRLGVWVVLVRWCNSTRGGRYYR